MFILRDANWERAFLRWQQLLQRGEEIVGPSLIHAEMTSIVRERLYLRKISEDQAHEALDWATSLPIDTSQDDAPLQRKAFEFATHFNRPKAYDAQYLAVADLLSCELWTADRRLVGVVGGELPWVRYVGDHA